MSLGASEVGCDRRAVRLADSIKRVFDISFSALAIGAFLPVFLVICIWIKLSTGGPVFFAHTRVGRDGVDFDCWKFRTMVVDAETLLDEVISIDPIRRAEWDKDRKLTNDPRIIPRIGTFLRKSSLDELPQFFNVLRGDMSVVGPRPVTREELLRYGPSASDYTRMRPGITGLWQTSGRNNLTYQQRIEMDVEYANSWTFWGDIRLVLLTAVQVISCRGSK